ncbi:MAG: membrane protein insertase YidC [Lentisphaerae bacterium]|nr:membrane protein insertase YidC [Lentisphaerota bacterium]
MKFDKETIIILVTCLVLMLAWPSISNRMGWTAPQENPAAEKQDAPQKKTAVEQKKTSAAPQIKVEQKPAPQAEIKPAVKPIAKKDIKNVELKNNEFTVTVSGRSGAVSAISFAGFKNHDQSADIEISALPGKEAQTSVVSYFIPNVATASDVLSIKKESDSAVTTTRLLQIPQGRFLLAQTVTLKDGYIINSKFTFTNPGKQSVAIPAAIVSGGAMKSWHLLSGDKIRSLAYTLDYMTAGGDFERIDADDDDDDFTVGKTEVSWAGAANKYFSLLLKSSGNYSLWQWRTFIDGDEKKPLIAAGANVPEMNLAPGESKVLEFDVYAGPKESDTLAAFAPGADKTLHLAWGPLNYLARFMMWVLNLLYSLCSSYGLSIILLTLLVRAAFYPITARGNESMKKMARVQPKLKEMREKYKDNPQLLNQKMTELYRQEGVNPLAGCLPILLQIPIFFALYAMLDNVIELRHVSFLWCKNLAAADTVCRIPMPFMADGLPLNPLVLVMTALMLVQQRMTPMSGDPMQKKMMMFMPVIMLLFLYDLPSGLTLYWTVSNIFSIVQLWLQQKRSQSPAAAAPGK